MKAFSVTMDGDNFIGIAYTDSEDKATEMGLEHCYGKKDILSVMEIPTKNEFTQEHFTTEEMLWHFPHE